MKVMPIRMELVWVVKHPLIPMCAADVESHNRTGRDWNSTDRYVTSCLAAEVHERRKQPQRFRECPVEFAPAGPCAAWYITLAEKAPKKIGDCLVGRLTSRHEQERNERAEVVRIKLLSIDLGDDESRDQVVAGISPSVLEDWFEILLELEMSEMAATAKFWIGPKTRHHRVVPPKEIVEISRRQTQKSCHDHSRHSMRDVSH
jgi:hypothetical protein